MVIPAVADEPVDDVAHETDQLLGGSKSHLLYQQLMSVAGMIPASSVQQQSQRYQYQVVEEPTKSTNVDGKASPLLLSPCSISDYLFLFFIILSSSLSVCIYSFSVSESSN